MQPCNPTTSHLKRLIVLGAGAVGGCIGGLLQRSGLPVVLVARGEHGRVLSRDGLRICMPEATHQVPLECQKRLHDIQWRAGDAALLATKLQDARPILDDLLQAAGPSIPVICAVNGIHGEAWAAERFETVIGMMVWVLATHLVPGEVRLHSQGDLGVLDCGPQRGDPSMELTEELCAALQKAGFDALARRDIQRWKHAKWISNIGGAAQAMVHDDWQSVVRAARAEAIAVLDALEIERVPMDEFELRISRVLPAEIDGQKRQGGSTWQSRRRGKPLETVWIEGALAELAKQHGLPAPINSFLNQAAKCPRDLNSAEVLARS